MHPKHLSLLLVTAALAACGGSDDDAAPLTAQQQCEALAANSGLAATTMTIVYNAEGAASAGTPSRALPAHCVVTASTNPRTGVDGKSYAIGYRLTLPDNWNGRFLFMGGGGNDGTIGPAVGTNVGPLDDLRPALARG